MNRSDRGATLVPAVGAQVQRGVGRLAPKGAAAGTLTPEQRARLIAGGPNAGRVRPPDSHECTCGAMHSAGATVWTCAKHGKIVAD